MRHCICDAIEWGTEHSYWCNEYKGIIVDPDKQAYAKGETVMAGTVRPCCRTNYHEQHDPECGVNETEEPTMTDTGKPSYHEEKESHPGIKVRSCCSTFAGTEHRSSCPDIKSHSQARHPSSQRFHDIIDELKELHDRKQKDYGSDDDPFSNVRNSEDFGVPAWVGCMIRANDKMKRLQTMAKKGELANEAAEDSFRDLAVYAIIGLILFEEQYAVSVPS